MYRFYRFMYGLVGFSRSQTNGFLIFLPFMLIIMFSEPVFSRFSAARKRDYSEDIARLDSIIHLMKAEGYDGEDTTKALFPFDPNIASVEELIRLGLKAEIASRIINYRNKGGRFRVKDDLTRIWGMDSVVYSRLEPMIDLPERIAGRERTIIRRSEQSSFPTKTVKVYENRVRQDINLADSASLKKVFGIGEKLALRILRFRDLLGGYVSMTQLKDVYKLDSAVINRLEKQYFIEQDFIPRKLDINNAGQQDFAAHPYLSSKAAHAIVAYRLNHGEFQRIEDLRKIPAIDSIMFRKVRPYLTINARE